MSRCAHWLLLALLAGGCHVEPAPLGQLPAAGLPRVYKVAEHVFRGPQPTSFQQFVAIMHLAPAGTKWCDVKLNTALPFDGGRDFLPPDFDEYQHPWKPFGPVTHDEAQEALDDVDRCVADGSYVYEHCLHGEDRTGLIVMLERMRWAPKWVPRALVADQAWREALHYGFHDGSVNKVAGFGLEDLVESFMREARLFTGDPSWRPS